MVDLCPVVKWSGIQMEVWKPDWKKCCLWSKKSGIQMARQVTWLYHLNTGQPYCPVFRCSVFRWLLYLLKNASNKFLLLNYSQLSSGKVWGLGLCAAQIVQLLHNGLDFIIWSVQWGFKRFGIIAKIFSSALNYTLGPRKWLFYQCRWEVWGDGVLLLVSHYQFALGLRHLTGSGWWRGILKIEFTKKLNCKDLVYNNYP